MKRYGFRLLLLSCLGGCGTFDVPFTCGTDEQCEKTHANGICEPTGNCSFPDASCPSQRRYADLAKEALRNQCVPAPVHLALGDRQSCAVLLGGELRCWGAPPKTGPEAVHLLGLGTDDVYAFNLPLVSEVALAEDHGCAVADGKVWCWGNNENGQLGVDLTSASGPHEVRAVAEENGTAKSVTTGRRHSCSLSRGHVWCWGDNSEGQLGRPRLRDRQEPAEVTAALEDVVALMAGESHTCAQPAWGLLNCWGSNRFGQIAAPLEVLASDEPHELPFYALSFSLGGSHTCAINTSGEVLCWGNNALGQLGRAPNPEGSLESQLSPTPLRVARDGTSEWMKATHIACGWAHSCAILADGTVACWGDNREGQLGPEATFIAGVSTPVAVVLPARAVEIGAGRNHTCARTIDGLTWCWGDNERGQLGSGSTEDSPLPDPHVSTLLATP